MLFEDVHSYDARYFYEIPNENSIIWRDLIKTKPIYKAAGICSSGEVGFFGILPLVRDELILIDHSYGSLHIAMIKYLIMKEKGTKEAYRLLTSGSRQELEDAIKDISPQIPGKVKARKGNPITYSHSAGHLRNEWGKVPSKVIKKAGTKLDRVKFIHGDLTDLAKDGPYGLLYLSNALDHSNREQKAAIKSIKQIESVVKPNGYVICATSHGYSEDKNYQCGKMREFKKRGWKLLNNARSGQWNQNLYQLPA